MNTYDIGIIGLGVMGRHMALNMLTHGYSIAAYDRESNAAYSAVARFVSDTCRGKKIILASSLSALPGLVKTPRKILILIQAGPAVDQVIEQLLPDLGANDIIVDGGNSHYKDTNRRISFLHSRSVQMIGCGISGGWEGALHGPAIMPGGSLAAWEHVRSVLLSVAAQHEDGTPCCEWLGPEGSGHFVKMVHNGIEYALMQSIAEAYDYMKRILGMADDEIASTFSRWNAGILRSYLVGITSEILSLRDNGGHPILAGIRDCAHQKGTGKDISTAALELGIPATTITEAVHARELSCMTEERKAASSVFNRATGRSGAGKALLDPLHDAVYCAHLVIFSQGMSLIAQASATYRWGLDCAAVSRIWRSGCIIQSDLADVIAAHVEPSYPKPLLQLPPFRDAIMQKQRNWRYAVMSAFECGIPLPVLSSALSWFDGYRSRRLPTNLIQAQRDYFGAHGYERQDAQHGRLFHLKREGHNDVV